MLDGQNDSPQSEDTTPAQLQEMLEHADKLLKSVEEGVQNPLANARRRLAVGHEIDVEKVLERARTAIADVERQAPPLSAS